MEVILAIAIKIKDAFTLWLSQPTHENYPADTSANV